MALLDDLAAPGGHSAVQQALAHAVLVRVAQLGDVADGFQPLDLDALPIALKLEVTLKGGGGKDSSVVAPARHRAWEPGRSRTRRRMVARMWHTASISSCEKPITSRALITALWLARSLLEV